MENTVVVKNQIDFCFFFDLLTVYNYYKTELDNPLKSGYKDHYLHGAVGRMRVIFFENIRFGKIVTNWFLLVIFEAIQNMYI